MLVDEVASLDFCKVLIVRPAFLPELLVVGLKDLVPCLSLLVAIVSVLVLHSSEVIMHVSQLQLLLLELLSFLVDFHAQLSETFDLGWLTVRAKTAITPLSNTPDLVHEAAYLHLRVLNLVLGILESVPLNDELTHALRKLPNRELLISLLLSALKCKLLASLQLRLREG